MQLFIIDCIITNNTGNYLTFHERILCLFIIKIIGVLSFDCQFINNLSFLLLSKSCLFIFHFKPFVVAVIRLVIETGCLLLAVLE